MSPEERQLLTGLFDRIRGAAGTPRDPEAEALISDTIKTMPYAPYLLAQAVIVQDQALQAANNKIQELQAQLQDAQQPRQAAGAGGFLGGLGSIFGGGNQQAQPRPMAPPPPQPPAWGQQPSYAPPPPAGAGPWGGAPMGGNPGGFMGGAPGGGGFLKGALGAAAGVAGGVLLADGIRNLFGAHNNPMGIGTGFSPGAGGETVVNNFYDGDGAPGTDSIDYGSDPSSSAGALDTSFDDSGDFGADSDSGTFDA